MITIAEEKDGNNLKYSLLQPLSIPDSVALSHNPYLDEKKGGGVL
jgi:hypothetical protein